MKKGSTQAGKKQRSVRTVSRVLIGSGLAGAGMAHLTFARKEFQAQVPEIVPLPKDATVLGSGMAEIVLGLALIFPGRHERAVGLTVAGFFTAVFPGNVAQWKHRRDGFGLNSDRKRAIRLWFQPALVTGVLWATTRGR